MIFSIPAIDYVGAPLLVLMFGLMLWLQARSALRHQRFSLFKRVVRNLTIAGPVFLTLRLLLIPVPLLVAAWADRHQFGLLHWLFPETGGWRWVQGVLGFVLFDYAYYGWHYATHIVLFLWRFHNVHHTDLDMDVSTASRFHFGEVALSTFFRVATVLLFGISVWSAIIYEIVFELAAQFHHSNWRLSEKTEHRINQVFVTPRMHGIHHSIIRDEFNSNWGTLFSWWDRLHRTHRMDIPQHAIIIGVPAYRDETELSATQLLAMPFGPQRDWKLPSGKYTDTRPDSPEEAKGE